MTADMSNDKMWQEFIDYKNRKLAQLRDELSQECLGIEQDLAQMRFNLAGMREALNDIKQEMNEVVAQNCADMETASSDDIETLSTSTCSARYEEETEKILVLTSKSTCCLFEYCDRRLDSQLLLIHYLSDHGNVYGINDFHELAEGERVVLSFDLLRRPLGENQVLGLLAYSGTIEQKVYKPTRKIVYNSFLTEQYEHLRSHLPITVMLCKTVPRAVLIDKMFAKSITTDDFDALNDLLYIFWLVSPIDGTHLNATLTIYGRDPIDTMSTVIAVRPISHAQNVSKFMALDRNYFCLTYGNAQQLTNDFRDELNLEISLTEYKRQDLLKMNPFAD